jgi:hypothetical protein
VPPVSRPTPVCTGRERQPGAGVPPVSRPTPVCTGRERQPGDLRWIWRSIRYPSSYKKTKGQRGWNAERRSTLLLLLPYPPQKSARECPEFWILHPCLDSPCRFSFCFFFFSREKKKKTGPGATPRICITSLGGSLRLLIGFDYLGDDNPYPHQQDDAGDRAGKEDTGVAAA